MLITILEAHVLEEHWPLLQRAFDQATRLLDAGIEQTYLIQSTRERDLWRILTVWESQEALDRIRNSGETPRGVLMFRMASAEPVLSIFGVVQHASSKASA